MSQLLLIGSSVALVLLVVHSWRTRGRLVTVLFFASGVLFGVLRGNAVYWLLYYTSGGASAGAKPYMPQGAFLPEIGHESVQVAVGWVFAAYLAWTISEMILRRVGGKGDSPPNSVKGTVPFSSRIFLIGGLAALFMAAICWVMETTAVAVGWWYWTLPTRTALFGNVNVAGMEAWFSIAPDFLIPFLAVACAGTQSRWKWLWLAVFPLHMFAHMAYAWWAQAYLIYPALAMVVVVPATFSRMKLTRGALPATQDRTSAALLAGAIVIFFGVILAASIAAKAGPAPAVTALPMLMLCLLAWKRVPAIVVAALSSAGAACWAVTGPTALWVLAPALAFGFLWLHARFYEPLWMKAAPTVAALALSIVSSVAFETDKARLRDYVGAWQAGDNAASAEDAPRAYSRIEALRPHDVLMLYEGIRVEMDFGWYGPDEGAAFFSRRLSRIITELEEVVRRDPDGIPPREDLAFYDVVAGRLAAATEQYREIHRLRPADKESEAMLGYLLLRERKLDEAERLTRDAASGKGASAKAMVNLGVILASRGEDNEARTLWTRALEIDPKQPVARQDLALPRGPRGIDDRLLARPGPGGHLAWLVNNLARLDPGLSQNERERLYLEATYLDPAFRSPRANLARLYQVRGNPGDSDREAWQNWYVGTFPTWAQGSK